MLTGAAAAHVRRAAAASRRSPPKAIRRAVDVAAAVRVARQGTLAARMGMATAAAEGAAEAVGGGDPMNHVEATRGNAAAAMSGSQPIDDI